uniref:Reverse transcriptase domain-containing protein n=1 Tax=Tanacetum cinerariifolium TaxID=118510 RepID=A0A6L2NV77_TANCI|nr:reverse transcriptase domain-containing protein [Tanacetum cinerariifolium]
MHLKRQIEEMLKAEKLSYLIKELKQNHGKDQAKTTKKGETSGKEIPLEILMVQSWQRIARQRITQTFSPKSIISFPTLGEEDGTEGPMIIEAEMGGHCVHRMYVDGGSSSKILEIIWPLGQISLLVKIDNEEHSTSAWMNFMVVRSPSPYNGIIGRPWVRKIRAIPSTMHEMLKFCVVGGIVTLRSSRIILLECSMVSEPGVPRPEGRKELCELLRYHLDVFAWKLTDMTRVPWHIADHRLNVREGCLPVRQKKIGQAPERNKAISEELKNVRGFQGLKQSVPQRWLSATENRLEGKREVDYHLAAAKEAISAVLMTERDEKQVPIYFVSRALQGPEINYTLMKKLILALVSANKRLKRYFQAHTIVVITDQPIKQLLSNPEVTGRLLKWRFKLGEHDIQYRPRTSVKGQILADFIVERLEDDTPDTSMEDMKELPDLYILFTDGSSCIDSSGAGLIITNPKGMESTYALRFRFNATNNEAGYEALIAGLRIAGQMGGKINRQKRDTSGSIRRGAHMDESGLRISYEMILPEEKRKQGLCTAKQEDMPVIHDGSCIMHAGPRSVVAKALRSGYYWPTMHTDARNLIRECNDCQKGENESLGERIKARLRDKNKNWVEEISHVLWAHRTMIKSSNGETPFSLTYGVEAVIPAEIGMPTLRTTEVDIVKNNKGLGISLDLLEEKREQAAIQEARSKAKIERYYNARVQNTSFRPGDFVYWNNEASHAEDEGKLRPKWEGPYEVTEALGKGACMLRDRNGHTLP